MQMMIDVSESELQAIANKTGISRKLLDLDMVEQTIHESLEQYAVKEEISDGTESYVFVPEVKELLNKLMCLQCRLESSECVGYNVKLPKISAMRETHLLMKHTKEQLEKHGVPEWVIEKALDFSRNYNYLEYNFDNFYKQK